MRRYIWTCSVTILLVGLVACGHRAANSASPTVEQRPQPSAASGTEVDLDVKDAELLDTLGQLAGKGGINIFADPDLNDAGLVTMSVHSTPAPDVLAKIAYDHQLRVEKLEVRGVDHAAYWITRESSDPAPVTSFSGARITARFDETPIRDVAKSLAEVAKTNIVVDDGVQANITLHLRLPWDLALYHLAQKYELRIVRGADELRITRRN